MRSIFKLQVKWKETDIRSFDAWFVPLLILIKFCWNILVFIRGKPSRHCCYTTEWECVWSDSREKEKTAKNKSQECRQQKKKKVDVDFTRQTKKTSSPYQHLEDEGKERGGREREMQGRKVTSPLFLISLDTARVWQQQQLKVEQWTRRELSREVRDLS